MIPTRKKITTPVIEPRSKRSPETRRKNRVIIVVKPRESVVAVPVAREPARPLPCFTVTVCRVPSAPPFGPVMFFDLPQTALQVIERLPQDRELLLNLVLSTNGT